MKASVRRKSPERNITMIEKGVRSKGWPCISVLWVFSSASESNSSKSPSNRSEVLLDIGAPFTGPVQTAQPGRRDSVNQASPRKEAPLATERARMLAVARDSLDYIPFAALSNCRKVFIDLKSAANFSSP